MEIRSAMEWTSEARHSGVLTRFLVLASFLSVLFFCNNGSQREEQGVKKIHVRPLNLFLDVLEIPDKDYGKKTPDEIRGTDDPRALREHKIWIKKIDAIYEQSRDGKNEKERTEIDRKRFLARNAVFFDMRLGAEHPGKKAFLKIAEWYFWMKLKVEKKYPPHRKETPERFSEYYDRLVPEVKKRLSNILNDRDYLKLVGKKKGAKGI